MLDQIDEDETHGEQELMRVAEEVISRQLGKDRAIAQSVAEQVAKRTRDVRQAIQVAKRTRDEVDRLEEYRAHRI